jgi:hypothetical protein
VLRLSPFPPKVTTDCLGLLGFLEMGRCAATSHDKVLARVWGMIYSALDCEHGPAMINITWMPSHSNRNSIGNVFTSAGQPVGVRQWRANRLVDAIAKHEARRHRLRAVDLAKLRVAEKAARHSAAVLGMVTHAANHFLTHVPNPDGTLVARWLRDSTACSMRRPRATKPGTPAMQSFGRPASKPALFGSEPAVCVVAAPCCLPEQMGMQSARALKVRTKHRMISTRNVVAAGKGRAAACAAARQALRQESRFQATWRTRLANAKHPSSGASASDRIDALTQRVRLRAAVARRAANQGSSSAGTS